MNFVRKLQDWYATFVSCLKRKKNEWHGNFTYLLSSPCVHHTPISISILHHSRLIFNLIRAGLGCWSLRSGIACLLTNQVVSTGCFICLADLIWVELDLECYTILSSCSVVSAKVPSAQAETGRLRNTQDQSHPKQGPWADGTPCMYCPNSVNHRNRFRAEYSAESISVKFLSFGDERKVRLLPNIR